ncbi:MAG: 23S rRNA (pseudouridine(1915)-N(3))-methyltransferase RlmH [Clostridiales bacterium]|nr:23S rRNA (pseudouridine(1915)-N(3))-methyltransferase RlmH [Clostridiales bacterium]
MKVRIVCVGKVKEGYFLSGIQEYLKRLTRFCKAEIVEIKEENFTENPSESEKQRILQKEGENILCALRGKVVALCVEGKQTDSVGFSRILREVKDGGGEITFVIGGSYGLLEEVKQRADLRLSFSEMTFPHTLMRLILTEQIYRGFTIMQGSPYHK